MSADWVVAVGGVSFGVLGCGVLGLGLGIGSDVGVKAGVGRGGFGAEGIFSKGLRVLAGSQGEESLER